MQKLLKKQELKKAAEQIASLLDEVGITVEDDHTLVVELEQPTAYFLDLTAFHTFFPVNPKVVEGKADWAQDQSDELCNEWSFPNGVVEA